MTWTPILSPAQLVGIHESSVFDAKQTYDLTLAETPFEMAKDVAAMASAMGGTVLVGAIEGRDATKGRIVAFKDVTDSGKLIAALSQAVARRCRPLPVFNPIELRIDRTAQRAILAREPASESVNLLAINIWPLPSGPVGVEASDARGQILEFAYRFPLRRGEKTEYLRPEELALHLSPHERRIAILLRQIPNTDRLAEAPVEVRLFDLRVHPAAQHFQGRKVKLVAIDDHFQHAVLDDVANRRANVPFTFIKTIWQSSDGDWCLHVDGTVHYSESASGNFHPGPGYA